jgi:hypothetical protein
MVLVLEFSSLFRTVCCDVDAIACGNVGSYVWQPLQYRTMRLSVKNIAEASSNVTVVSARFFTDNEGWVMSFIHLCLSLLS